MYLKKTLALLLALVMVLSLVPVFPVHAEEAETEPIGEASSSYYPWKHGYRFVDVLNFDPATDPYSQELVANVPLQDRNAAFAATQANPELLDQARLYAISSSNYRSTGGDGGWYGGVAYDEFSNNVLKFWQYLDMTGAGGRPTQGIAVGAENNEYGVIAVPSPAGTNAAHKNGVLSIAEYFIPRKPQYTEEWLYKDEDGNFPYAQKLVDMMNFYGYDGYFINQEGAINESFVPLFREMLAWMRAQGCYIQWYDSVTTGGVAYQNAFNSNNSDWVWNEKNGRVTDSIFLNYWYQPTAIKDSAAYARSLGLDPYETVFMGYEGNEWKVRFDLDTQYNVVDPETDQPYTSFAIWGSDWYHEGVTGCYDVEHQWQYEERERIFFTSPMESVLDHTNGFKRNDIQYGDALNFRGFSKYIVEKSVINGTVFATDFNNGHGMQYFKNGEVSRDVEWTNLNLQDILPTWQWWIESSDENQLDLDWDYGPAFYRSNGDFPYTQVGAYNGGSSLVLYGDVKGSQLVNLYKTSMDINENSTFSLTYNKVSDDDATALRLALVFEDDPENPVYLPIENAGKHTQGWTTAEVKLSTCAGRKLAAFGLDVSAPEKVEGYQLNLGRIIITDGSDCVPQAPVGLTLANRFDTTGEMQLNWELADYDAVKNYHIYAGYADGSERFVGGGYAATYVIKTLEDAENITCLKLVAVGVDGSESAPAIISLEQSNRVSNVRAVSENNVLSVTWDDPDASFANVEVSLNYWYSEKDDPAPVVVAKGVEAAEVEIPLEDGSRYILKISTVNKDGSRNQAVSYFSSLKDSYCAPYAGSARPSMLRPGEQICIYNLTTPANSDWAVAYVEAGGKTVAYGRFGSNNKSLTSFGVSANGLSTIVVTLEDVSGNRSEPTILPFIDGQPVSNDYLYGEELIPDPVLRAVLQGKIGETIGELLNYQGSLDLSNLLIRNYAGLNEISGLTALDLTENHIEKLTAEMLPTGLKKVNLTGCDRLALVNLDGREDVEVDLTGCTALADLSLKNYSFASLDLSDCGELLYVDLSGSKLERLDITALTNIHNLNISNSEISQLKTAAAKEYPHAYNWKWDNCRLDLSENTAEGQLVPGMRSHFENDEIPDELTNTASKAGSGNMSAAATSVVVNLKSPRFLANLELENKFAMLGFSLPKNLTVLVSADGATYTQAASFDGIGGAKIKLELPAGTCASYVKLTTTDTNARMSAQVTINAFDAAPKGFTCGGQKPAVIRDDVRAAEFAADGAVHQLLDLLAERYASTRTLSGKLLSELADADWIDASYLRQESAVPSGVSVVVTDSQGNSREAAELIADTLDTYAVSYLKSGTELASTTVTVRVPTVEEVIAAIDAIGAPITLESKDVLKAARAAYENLPEDQKALVTNYSDLLAGEKAYADFFRGEYSDVLQARYEELTEDRYSNKGQAKLDAALADGLNRIAQAPNMQALDAALEEALANLNAVPNYQKEMELALEEANKAVLAASKYYAYVELMQIDLSDFNACQMAKAETVLAAARAAVDAAETVEAVDGAVAAAKEAVAEIAAQRCAAEEFSDVSLNDWFHEDADFMLNNGYMNGYPGGTFRPDVKVSRAQLVTILYRVAGEPEVEGAADFSDVAEDYYTNAVIWAAEQGITTGYPDGTFRPNAEVSRQELVTFLYRFAEAEAVEEDHLTQFPDAGKVADYAVESMNWAIANGIVSGAVRDNVLVIAPEDTARRDETCAIVARYMNAN